MKYGPVIPEEAGIQADRLMDDFRTGKTFWIPAFAGMTGLRLTMPG